MVRKPDSSLYLLGKYVSLALVLPSGAAAGYLVGRFLDHFWPSAFWIPALILLGVASGIIRLVQELLRDSKRSEANTVEEEDDRIA